MPSDDLPVQDVTTARGTFPGAVRLFRLWFLGHRLRSRDHRFGGVHDRLRGFLEDGEGLGAGVVDGFDGGVGCLGRGLEDGFGQLLGVLYDSGALVVGVEGSSVSAFVHLVVDVGGQVGVELISERVEALSYREPIAQIAQSGESIRLSE